MYLDAIKENKILTKCMIVVFHCHIQCTVLVLAICGVHYCSIAPQMKHSFSFLKFYIQVTLH